MKLHTFLIMLLNLSLGVFFIYLFGNELLGDEEMYYKRCFQLQKGNFRVLYGNHFMPGPIFLLYPCFLLFSYNVFILKCWVVVVNLFLNILIFYEAKKSKTAELFLLIIAIFPMLIMMSSRPFGDYTAGLLLLYSFIICTTNNFEKTSSIIKLSFVLVLIHYFRQSLSFVILVVAIFFILKMIQQNYSYKTKITKICFFGFFLILFLSPWIVPSSILKKKLIIHPGQTYNKISGMYNFYKIESLTPAYANYGMVNKPNILETVEKRGGYEIIIADLENKNESIDYLSAYYRNYKNIVFNENQFLASKFSVNFKPRENTKRNFSYVRQPYTYEGPFGAGRNDYIPANIILRCLLIFNSFLYYSLALLTGGFLFTLFLLNKCKVADFLFVAICAGFFSMVFFHIGHGRYIFSLLPLLIYQFVVMFERLISLRKKIA